jgi:hypothetical protein
MHVKLSIAEIIEKLGKKIGQKFEGNVQLRNAELFTLFSANIEKGLILAYLVY